ncbi:hypothetical protein ACQV5M_15170 [Leptospira sp. SA-E8]|uniref:hypothetical protein n=1 Tax=Leptospira sp. SA-E8 TaxID=3422259 RepID=UPI003EC0E212
MTSKEANCRKAMRNDLGALVELSPEDVSDYFNSPQKSFIKCNAPNLNKISFLDLNHISSKDTRDKSKLRISNDIKQKILSAVTATQTMPDSIREVILNNASI